MLTTSRKAAYMHHILVFFFDLHLFYIMKPVSRNPTCWSNISFSFLAIFNWKVMMDSYLSNVTIFILKKKTRLGTNSKTIISNYWGWRPLSMWKLQDAPFLKPELLSFQIQIFLLFKTCHHHISFQDWWLHKLFLKSGMYFSPPHVIALINSQALSWTAWIKSYEILFDCC